ncbi:MAG TPA: hypothetical protein DCM87_08185, partial [Planctomycetes bacterium]|nr:hypothetical protein [Planctomycetota bacterium]
NFWYCADNPPRSIPALPAAETGGRGGRDPLLADPEKGDCTVKEDSPARGAGAAACPAPSPRG